MRATVAVKCCHGFEFLVYNLLFSLFPPLSFSIPPPGLFIPVVFVKLCCQCHFFPDFFLKLLLLCCGWYSGVVVSPAGSQLEGPGFETNFGPFWVAAECQALWFPPRGHAH